MKTENHAYRLPAIQCQEMSYGLEISQESMMFSVIFCKWRKLQLKQNETVCLIASISPRYKRQIFFSSSYFEIAFEFIRMSSIDSANIQQFNIIYSNSIDHVGIDNIYIVHVSHRLSKTTFQFGFCG